LAGLARPGARSGWLDPSQANPTTWIILVAVATISATGMCWPTSAAWRADQYDVDRVDRE
jgi:hypothetical protein